MAIPETYDDYWQKKHQLRPNDEWEKHIWDKERTQRVLGPILGKASVLDYGCGTGWSYRPQLSATVGKYSGADVSEFALSTLDTQTQEAYRINPDNSSISAKDGSFDGACSIEVLEHVFDPLATARELYRVLKPGGVLVATVPNFGYHAWRLMAFLRARVPSEPERPEENSYNGVHIRFFSAGTFKRLFLDAGFSQVSISSFDDSTIWDITRGLGPVAILSDWARRRLPPLLNLRFLQDVYPPLFAYRIRAVAIKAR